MRHKQHVVFSLVFLIAVLLLSGCSIPKNVNLTGTDAYNAAVNALEGSHFNITVSAVQMTQTDAHTLSETTVARISYNNFGQSNMRVASETTVTAGQHSFSASEICVDGTIFLDINGGLFSASVPTEQLAARYFPPALLDPSLYGSIQHQHSNGHQIIGFTQPKQAESWAMPEGAQFTDATGTAVLLTDGTLFESTYSITYSYGSATIAYTVTARFDRQSKQAINMPQAAESYIPITNIDAPLLLESACTKLLGVSDVSSQAVSDIICEAGGLQRMQQTTTSLSETAAGLNAQVDTQVELINHNHQGTAKSFTQTESFTGGKYTISSGSAAESSDPVTEDEMRTYCKNNLVSSVMLPQYITDAEFTETEGCYLLTFTASESLAQLLFTNAYQALYTDQTVSAELIDSYTTESVSGHIEINKATGLPICSGLSYRGTNTIDASSHAFVVNTEQTYSYGQ